MAHSKIGKISVTVMTLVFAFAFSSRVLAQADTPVLRPFQFVYGIPTGYENELLGAAAVNRMNERLSQLHHPFYVVVLQRLEGGNDANKAATLTLEQFVSDWRQLPNGLYTNESSAFLLISQPRKYRIVAGSQWANRLGLHDSQVNEFAVQHFIPYMHRQPMDPLTGILETAVSLDNYIFYRTDPDFLRRKREEEERRAREELLRQQANEHARAIRDLQSEIDRGERYLEEFRAYLPTDHHLHSEALDHAKQEIERADIPTSVIVEHQQRLAEQNNRLQSHIDDRIFRKKWHTYRWMLLGAVLMALGGFLYRRGSRRQIRIQDKKLSLQRKLSVMQAKIENAQARLMKFIEERDFIEKLSSRKGETERLYQEVTTTVDEVLIIIESWREHLAKIQLLVSKGGFFQEDPLQEADVLLNASFQFDTGVIDQKRLFHPQTVQREMSPGTFETELGLQYEKAMVGWDRLKKAYESTQQSPMTCFNERQYQRWVDFANAKSISSQWLAQHPCHKNRAMVIEQELLGLQSTDPVRYLVRIEELLLDQEKCFGDLSKIKQMIEFVKSPLNLRVLEQDIVVDPEEDPDTYRERVYEKEALFFARLSSVAHIEQLERNFNEIQSLRKTAIEKAEYLYQISQKIAQDLEDVIREKADLTDKYRAITVERESMVHQSVDAKRIDLDQFKNYLTRAEALIATAKECMKSRALIVAMRHLDEAKHALQQARQKHTEATEATKELSALIVSGPNRIKQVADSIKQIVDQERMLSSRLKKAEKTYAHTNKAKAFFVQGETYLRQAETDMNRLQSCFDQREHHKLERIASSIDSKLDDVRKYFDRTTNWLEEQDSKKLEFERQYSKLSSVRDAAKRQIREYGGNSSLKDFDRVDASKALDYEILLASVMQMHQSWMNSVQSAKRDYEDRLEEERRERQRQEEEESRRHSYGSSSDVGGGHWGGGGSDIGGGDWGGGGSDVGGGDY